MKEVKTNVDAAVILTALQAQAKPLFKQLSSVKISDNTTLELKASRVAALKQLYKLAETKESSLVDPLKQVIKDIQALFKPFKDLIDQAEADTKKEMVDYDADVERKKEKIKTNLAEGKIKKVSTAVSNIAAIEVHTSSASFVNRWTVEEVNAKLTPLEYLTPDLAKIKQALKEGKQVKGWKYVQKKSVSI